MLVLRAALALLSLSLAAPVAAAACAPYTEVTNTLTRKYSEARQSVARAGPLQVITVWANLETGSWTITATQAETGITCVVAAGQQYILLMEPAGEAM